MNCLLASDQQVFRKIIRTCNNFLFDCDGVLWQGNNIITGAVDAVNRLQKLGKQVIFITNNSTKTRKQFFEKLTTLGFNAKSSNIFATAYTSALCIKNEYKIKNRVYVVGNESMAEELKDMGIDYFGIGPDNAIVTQNHAEIAKCVLERNVGAVLVGFDGHFSITKLVKAASYLNNPHCVYIATNKDSRLPLKEAQHVVPGTGCLVNSVTTAAGKPPDMWCGKPETFMFKCVQNELDLDYQHSIMIGDRLDTDILFGKRNGLKTLLVLSGIASEKTLKNFAHSENKDLKDQLPDYYMPSIGLWASMFEYLN